VVEKSAEDGTTLPAPQAAADSSTAVAAAVAALDDVVLGGAGNPGCSKCHLSVEGMVLVLEQLMVAILEHNCCAHDDTIRSYSYTWL
jgi:hypothetical protein